MRSQMPLDGLEKVVDNPNQDHAPWTGTVKSGMEKVEKNLKIFGESAYSRSPQIDLKNEGGKLSFLMSTSSLGRDDGTKFTRLSTEE